MQPLSIPPIVEGIRTWVQRPGVRRGFSLLGLVLVAFGAIWSVATLDLSWRTVSPGLLLVNLLALAPLNILFAAISLRINASALDCDIPTPRSIYTVAAANVAELLPLPGGAVIRGAALVDAGARLVDSTRIIILTSLLTLFMTVTLSLAALAFLADPAWGWLALGSALGLAGILFVMTRHIAATHLLAMLAIRIAILSLTMLRIGVAFAIFGAAISWVETALYAVAPTLGATVAIVPAGLGVNEAIAAGLAALIAGSSATAFLSVALNRVLELSAGAVMVFAMSLRKGSGGS